MENNMPLTFYLGAGSPFAWRVHLALEHKRLPYELKVLSFAAGDTRKPEFLALNPRHHVPVIQDGDFVLYESAVILEYLEDKYPAADPATALFPKDVQARAITRRMAREAEIYFGLEGMERLVAQVFFTKPEERSAKELDKGMKVVADELAFFEKEIRGDFLAGPLSAADFTLYPLLAFSLRAEKKYPDAAVSKLIGPRMLAWKARIEALPYFQKTWPPHWK
jgi:glutathione S-transferase